MGLRGPVPIPTAINALRGNPGKRKNKREPKPDVSEPVCPQHIKENADAKAEWDRLVPILLRMKVLTEADGLILANLCLAHANLLLNLRKVAALNSGSNTGIAGLVIATKSGYLAPNQLYLNVQSCMEQELKFCRELGLTPSARARLQTPGQPEKTDDKWARLASR